MRSKDRLAELRHLASGAATGVYHDTVEVSLKEPEHNKEILDIFAEVELARGCIHEVEGATQLARRLYADPTFHTNKQLQEQLDGAAGAAAGAARRGVAVLRRLEGHAAAGAGRNDAAARIARLQHAACRRHYARALRRHHDALDAVRQDRLRLLADQIRLTNLTISDEECQSLLDSNNISLFVDNVRAETAEARRALRDVEARHAELARAEAALRDVRELFAQLAQLVQLQQDALDSVAYCALQAHEHVGSGGAHLLKGTVSRAKGRKKKLGLVVCLVAGVAIVLFVLIVT